VQLFSASGFIRAYDSTRIATIIHLELLFRGFTIPDPAYVRRIDAELSCYASKRHRTADANEDVPELLAACARAGLWRICDERKRGDFRLLWSAHVVAARECRGSTGSRMPVQRETHLSVAVSLHLLSG
jgi:hypothetical protein